MALIDFCVLKPLSSSPGAGVGQWPLRACRVVRGRRGNSPPPPPTLCSSGGTCGSTAASVEDPGHSDPAREHS